jgi:hypothetical protein
MRGVGYDLKGSIKGSRGWAYWAEFLAEITEDDR